MATKHAAKKPIHETVTDSICQLLETGTIPWVMPWSQVRPQSVDGHIYSGMNMFLLTWAVVQNNYTDPRFVTFFRATELEGHVKKGEHGYPITIYTKYDKDVIGADGTVQIETKSYLDCKYVFNVSQCEGLNLKPLKEFHKIDPITRAEEVISHMPNRPEIRFGTGRCGYYPTLDYIEMACKELFKTSEHYYATLFHELSHSTAHETRLDRKIDDHVFGDHEYSKEELVAEMTAAMLLCECGIDSPDTLNQNAAYIAGWLKALNNDKTMLTYASGKASAAAKYIIGKSQFDQDDDTEELPDTQKAA